MQNLKLNSELLAKDENGNFYCIICGATHTLTPKNYITGDFDNDLIWDIRYETGDKWHLAVGALSDIVHVLQNDWGNATKKWVLTREYDEFGTWDDYFTLVLHDADEDGDLTFVLTQHECDE